MTPISPVSKSALAYWMLEVPKAVAKASEGFASKPVHDLRVAPRRCRSMADGFRAFDPHKDWKKMRRQAKLLFVSLGALRDGQVMREWVEKLANGDDPIGVKLLAHLGERESGFKQQAEEAVRAFDHRQWQNLARSLSRRAARIRPGSPPFQALALEKLNAARRLQAPALKTGNETACHRLRIGLKKFRYVVENFLPQQHEAWKDDLKQVQDLLGEVHDLDVLRASVAEVSNGEPEPDRERWRQRLEQERAVRMERYREIMSGAAARWLAWRSALPRGEAARQASLKRLEAWSSFLDRDQQHSRRVARFAVRIFDGLSRLGVLRAVQANDRALLEAAAVVHEVGRSAGRKAHHKRIEGMISQLDRVAGWTLQDLRMMGRVARYHRGRLPEAARLSDLTPGARQRLMALAGILRLANTFDADHDGSIAQLRVTRDQGYVVIHAAGLPPDSGLGEKIAGARHLLERACGLPILVEPWTRRAKKRKTLTSS